MINQLNIDKAMKCCEFSAEMGLGYVINPTGLKLSHEETLYIAAHTPNNLAHIKAVFFNYD